MNVQRETVTVTTESDGSAEAYSENVSGVLSGVRYVKDGSNGFVDGVDFTITAEATGETLWQESNVNASATRAPRQATHGTDGAASLYAAGGAAVQAQIPLANDRIKIVIASGGDSKVGTFHFTFI